MPLYEYQCDACAHRFEKIQKFSDPPLEVCPQCGGKVQKLLSSPAIQFKGSGWYVTDYAKKSSSEKSAGKGEKTADKGASEKTSDSGKSESSTPASTTTKSD